MKRLFLVAALPLVLAACGGSAGGVAGASTSSEGTVTVQLAEQNGSGESGTATLTAVGGGKTRVVLELKNPAAASQPAHIHAGSCAKLDPKPRYGLVNVTDGRSETVVDEPLSVLTGGGLAINVHRSNDDLGAYVACGDLPGGAGGTGSGDSGGGRYSY